MDGIVSFFWMSNKPKDVAMASDYPTRFQTTLIFADSKHIFSPLMRTQELSVILDAQLFPTFLRPNSLAPFS
jgi:hypothetical protein